MGIAAYAVMTTKDIVDNRQLGARGFIERLDLSFLPISAGTDNQSKAGERPTIFASPALSQDTVIKVLFALKNFLSMWLQ